jgi:hypothetical protein
MICEKVLFCPVYIRILNSVKNTKNYSAIERRKAGKFYHGGFGLPVHFPVFFTSCLNFGQGSKDGEGTGESVEMA